jgi:integrase/recombinase XerD
MLIQAVEQYLSVRRAAGYKLKTEGDLLRSFAKYSEAAGIQRVSSENAIAWASLAKSVETRARRLGQVIRFARFIRAEDQRHELPPPIFGSERRTRPIPYIFSQDEIRRLTKAASRLGRFNNFRGFTYSTLFALLACTGLRISEALNLRICDITRDGLLIHCSKFRKSRLVALHATTRRALERYLERRVPFAPLDDHLFVSLRKCRLRTDDADKIFHNLMQELGLPLKPQRPRPTIHSLRHTFAVRALETCPDTRDSITKHMVALSTYLGHSSVKGTYWYLESTPELMKRIADSSEEFFEGGRL